MGCGVEWWGLHGLVAHTDIDCFRNPTRMDFRPCIAAFGQLLIALVIGIVERIFRVVGISFSCLDFHKRSAAGNAR